MAWQTLPTLSNGGTPSATDLNKFQGNVNHLQSPVVHYNFFSPNKADFTSTSTTFVDIDADWSATFTTAGGRVFCLISMCFYNAAIDVLLDGTSLSGGATFGIASCSQSVAVHHHYNIPLLFASLSVASHTIKVQARRVNTGAANRLYYSMGARMTVIELT